MSAAIEGARSVDHGQPSGVRRLSEVLWDLDWSRLLPLDVGDGVLVTASSIEEALPFIQAHYAEIFEESPDDHRFWREPMSQARVRYYQQADFFEFKRAGQTVGLMIGTITDWSTYYIRSAAVLKAYQGLHLVQRLVRALCGWLKEAGVMRVELDTAPSNLAMVQIVTRLRFNLSGTILSERWGVNTRFTKFLDQTAENVFLRQYCSGVKYQLRERGEPLL
jgi:ribosomal protein S18 acetylase RimI-like enzyme